MCGRFNVIDNPGLQELLRDLGLDFSLPPGVNLAPTEDVPLVRATDSRKTLATDSHNTLDEARWWLTPSWAKEVSQAYSMFNARSENLARSPAFRTPFKRQRGLVPMTGFIEWRQEQGGKQPWLISSETGAIAVAALWDVWEGGEQPLLSCTLVTTAAAPAFKPWHGRMPVLLTREEWPRWLDSRQSIAPDDPVFRSELKMPLHLAPLDRAVSNSRNKNPELMQAVGEVVSLAG